MNRRRTLLAAFATAAETLAIAAVAQQARPVRRIGYLGGGRAENDAPWLASFREGLAQLRWVEGRDYVMDARYADNVREALPRLGSELVASRPDVILVPADGGASMLVKQTTTTPIVFAQATDPVGLGLVASLHRPGGNVTGLTSLVKELAPKRLQLLKEAFPRVAAIGVLSAIDPNGLNQVREIEEAAKGLGIRVPVLELRNPSDIEPAFKRGAALGVQAYTATTGVITINERGTIIERVLRAKLPAIFPISVFADSGGLLSYGISTTDNFRRAAGYVDRILKGAKAGDLPIEQPTKFELIANLKTARAMGITIPQAILVRADRVIE